MPAAAVAGAGLLISAYSAHEAGQAQSRAQDLQQNAIMADQAFRQKQYDDYKQLYGPMEQELVKQASSEAPLNLGPNWARVQANFDQAGRNNEVNMSRKGMIGSGLDTHNNLENARAYALSDAFSKGLQNRDALRLQALNLGRQMPQQAGAVMQGNQNLSNFWGNQSNLFAGAAGAAGQGMSSSLGALGYALGTTQQTPAPTVDAKTVAPTDIQTPIQPRDTSGWPDSLTPAYPGVAAMGNAFLPPSTSPIGAGNYTNYLGSSPIAGPRDQ